MDTDYNSEHYRDPLQTYNRISDKVKLGHILFNTVMGSYVRVDLEVLGEILEFENEKNENRKYIPVPINDVWLTSIFNFDRKELHSGTYFTSGVHGFKIAKQGNRYLFGYTLREKGYGGNATFNLRPRILFVHELMDLLFLMKREQFKCTEEDLDRINSIVPAQDIS